jgi:hypothetical protein
MVSRRPRYKYKQLCPPDFGKMPKYMMKKRQPLQQMFQGKLDICMQKT